jgi:nucleotide-binding universal stress UspA family protein
LWASYAPAAEIIGTIDRLEADARLRLERMVPSDDLTGGRVVVATEWGDPVDEILKYASRHDIDLIVCGTHGRRGWNHLVMGSVAENVVRLAPCPVLTVPAHAAAAAAA